MVIVIIAALILAAPFVVGAYLRLAKRSAERAHDAWQLVERHAHVLLEDRRLDAGLGDLVETTVRHIGDGRLTRAFLGSLILKRNRRSDSRIEAAMASLNPEQEKQFLHFLVAALFFDSLTSPVLGVVLRRFMYWLAATAADRTAPVSRVQVEPVVSAAGRMCAA